MHEALRKRRVSSVLGQLFLLITLNLVAFGCASTPSTPASEAIYQARLRDLLDSVEIEKSRNATLARTVTRLENQLRTARAKKNAAENQIKVPKKKISRNAEKEEDFLLDDELPFPKKMVLKRLAPEPSETSNETESIADSSHEVMHWYYKGLKENENAEWEASLRSFEQFLEIAPNHVYADRAEYWLVDGYYKAREFQLAVVAANRLEARFQPSFRIPDGRLLSALAHYELGQKAAARERFRSLMKDFPQHRAAREAGAKLASLFPATSEKNPPRLLEPRVTEKR